MQAVPSDPESDPSPSRPFDVVPETDRSSPPDYVRQMWHDIAETAVFVGATILLILLILLVSLLARI